MDEGSEANRDEFTPGKWLSHEGGPSQGPMVSANDTEC